MGKIRIKDDPESQRIWKQIADVAREVESWPDWKKGKSVSKTSPELDKALSILMNSKPISLTAAREQALKVSEETEQRLKEERLADQDNLTWKAERYDFLIELWQKHTPLYWHWSHDEQFESYFSRAIPQLFESVIKARKTVDEQAEKQRQLESWIKTLDYFIDDPTVGGKLIARNFELYQENERLKDEIEQLKNKVKELEQDVDKYEI